MKIKFKCECGCERLEEVQIDAVISSNITEIEYDGEYADCEYSVPIIHDAYTDRYQCVNCGKAITDKDGNICANLEAVCEALK